jgi:hypothetical protein
MQGYDIGMSTIDAYQRVKQKQPFECVAMLLSIDEIRETVPPSLVALRYKLVGLSIVSNSKL